MNSYDTWLEQPYAERAAEQERHEAFQLTDRYWEAYEAWLIDHPGFVAAGEATFQDSPGYEAAYEEWMDEDD